MRRARNPPPPPLDESPRTSGAAFAVCEGNSAKIQFELIRGAALFTFFHGLLLPLARSALSSKPSPAVAVAATLEPFTRIQMVRFANFISLLKRFVFNENIISVKVFQFRVVNIVVDSLA